MSIYRILALILIVAIPVITGFLCGMLHKLALKYRHSTQNEKVNAIIYEIDEAVRSAVVYVNQTFVDELKNSGVFSEDEEYAKSAFEEAFETAIETISDDALDYLNRTFGDIRKYLTVKIEENVNFAKR